jgi:hypothetical protein
MLFRKECRRDLALGNAFGAIGHGVAIRPRPQARVQAQTPLHARARALVRTRSGTRTHSRAWNRPESPGKWDGWSPRCGEPWRRSERGGPWPRPRGCLPLLSHPEPGPARRIPVRDWEQLGPGYAFWDPVGTRCLWTRSRPFLPLQPAAARRGVARQARNAMPRAPAPCQRSPGTGRRASAPSRRHQPTLSAFRYRQLRYVGMYELERSRNGAVCALFVRQAHLMQGLPFDDCRIIRPYKEDVLVAQTLENSSSLSVVHDRCEAITRVFSHQGISIPAFRPVCARTLRSAEQYRFASTTAHSFLKLESRHLYSAVGVNAGLKIKWKVVAQFLNKGNKSPQINKIPLFVSKSLTAIGSNKQKYSLNSLLPLSSSNHFWPQVGRT